jgi:hypothetical protein
MKKFGKWLKKFGVIGRAGGKRGSERVGGGRGGRERGKERGLTYSIEFEENGRTVSRRLEWDVLLFVD